MNKNILKEHYDKKQNLLSLIDKAKGYGWISEKETLEIKERIERNVLTIGVIGQMKSGKSTFLNTFVFGDDVLPSATTPMTAALSVITYGEEKCIEAEFYTAEEWIEQKNTASMIVEESDQNSIRESKIKAAQELVRNNKLSEVELKGILGTTKKDTISNLSSYVGAEGKYVAITKSVKIYYPLEYLKGVEIVDTPGLNDPILSRGERTKEFLKKADVVVLMLYAGRPFDESDHNILFENIRQSGVGKVIIGLNKYDIPYQNGDTITELVDYVKKELAKASTDFDDSVMANIIADTEPIPISASMALLSQMSMEKIQRTDEYKFAFDRLTDVFEITSQKELMTKSLIENLFKAVSDVIEKEKNEILLRKPINVLKAVASRKKEELEKRIIIAKSHLSNLSIPDYELESKLQDLLTAQRKVEKRISYLDSDLINEYKTFVKKGKRQCEDIIESVFSDIGRDIDNFKRLGSEEKLIRKIQDKLEILYERKLDRAIKDAQEDIKKKLINETEIFITSIEDIFLHLIDDFDIKQVTSPLMDKISISSEIDTSGDSKEQNEELTFKEGLATLIYVLSGGAAVDVLVNKTKLGNLLFGREGLRKDLREEIKKQKYSIISWLEEYFNSLYSNKDSVISLIRQSLNEEIIVPLISQIEEIKSGKLDKETEKQKAKDELEKATKEKELISNQIEEFDRAIS